MKQYTGWIYLGIKKGHIVYIGQTYDKRGYQGRFANHRTRDNFEPVLYKEYTMDTFEGLKDVLNRTEQALIKEHDTFADTEKERLNHTTGGSYKKKFVMSEDAKKKISKTMKGKMKRGSLHPKSKEVIQLTTDGKEITRFGSGREASRETGICQISISRCCRGIKKSAGGYYWKFADSSAISKCCRGERKTAGGYYWRHDSVLP